jgi:hypothetical protein
MSLYSEYYNAITELTTLTRVNSFSEPAHALLLLHSSRVLMLHKSHTYCPRQMSSSSLIFSMGAISMKVNPASVSILIIATSLAIHLSTYIQPSHWLWGCSELGLLSWPTHLLLRCLRSSSCGGLKWGSYCSPHTFSKVSSPVVMGRSDPGSYHGPHTPSI